MTHWTVVLEAGQRDSSESRQKALAAFCESYWPPIYAFLRYRRYAPADAQDLVQGFFVHLCEKNVLEHADRGKGKLRTFLLSSLQNFLINEHDRATALKRGGHFQIVSLEESLPALEAAVSSGSNSNDEARYDLHWATSVVTRAWQNLCLELTEEGNGRWIEELKPFIAGGSAALPNQEDVAKRLDVPVATLRTWISRLRQRYRTALRAEVASTVANPNDTDEELRYLHRVLVS